MSVHKEIAFEDTIERAMLDAGWRKGQGAHYRRELGLVTAPLFEFLGATQIEQWSQLVEFEEPGRGRRVVSGL